jgi:S-adenosylmethionine hydrolase
LQELGTNINDPIRLDLLHPQSTSNGWTAHVIPIDRFGNIVTNLAEQSLANRADVCIRIRGHGILGLVQSYGHAKPGELVALVDSDGFLEIAQVNGNAAKTLGAQSDDPVEVVFGDGGL